MKLQIREANINDIVAIVKLNGQLSDYHRNIDNYYKSGSHTGEGFKNFLLNLIDNEDVLILVADIDSKIFGYFIGTIEKPKPFISAMKIGRISDAFIEKDYRKSGVGRKMFDILLEWFDNNDIKHIELSVDARNTIGVKAWKKFGFQEFMKKMRLDL